MAKIKSCVTFFRKQLGFRGRSEHNGRGVYEMEMLDADDNPVATDIVIKRAREVAKKLADNNKATFTEDDKYLMITINPELIEKETYGFMSRPTYSTLCVILPSGQVGVVF